MARETMAMMVKPPEGALQKIDGDPWTPVALVDSPLGQVFGVLCGPDLPPAAIVQLSSPEREYVAGLSARRAKEWVGGRLALIAALAHVGAKRCPLLPTSTGAPSVPLGFRGSIAHKGPIAVGIATEGGAGLGIDLEHVDASDQLLEGRVLTPLESRAVVTMTSAESASFVARSFAAKEAIFKAARPQDQQELEFEEIELCIQPAPRGDVWQPWGAKVRGLVPFSVFTLDDGAWVLSVAQQADWLTPLGCEDG